MDTIEKLKQPKTLEHKKQISIGMKMYWKRIKREEYGFNRQQAVKS